MLVKDPGGTGRRLDKPAAVLDAIINFRPGVVSMQKLAAAGAFAVLLFAGAAQAAPVVYTWTGSGENVPGSSKCPSGTISMPQGDAKRSEATRRRPS